MYVYLEFKNEPLMGIIKAGKEKLNSILFYFPKVYQLKYLLVVDAKTQSASMTLGGNITPEEEKALKSNVRAMLRKCYAIDISLKEIKKVELEQLEETINFEGVMSLNITSYSELYAHLT